MGTCIKIFSAIKMQKIFLRYFYVKPLVFAWSFTIFVQVTIKKLDIDTKKLRTMRE